MGLRHTTDRANGSRKRIGLMRSEMERGWEPSWKAAYARTTKRRIRVDTGLNDGSL